MAGGILGTVDDVALCIDSDLVMHFAHAADLRDMPHFTERLVIALRGRLHFQFLEAVLAAILAGMTLRNSLGSLEGDRFLFQQTLPLFLRRSVGVGAWSESRRRFA